MIDRVKMRSIPNRFLKWFLSTWYGQNAQPCLSCRDRGKSWAGSDPVCAFDLSESFNDNYACATLLELRELLHKPNDLIKGSVFEGQHSVLVDLMFTEFPNRHVVGLYISWYKRRGSTEQIWLLSDNLDPRIPTEQECLLVIHELKMRELVK